MVAIVTVWGLEFLRWATGEHLSPGMIEKHSVDAVVGNGFDSHKKKLLV